MGWGRGRAREGREQVERTGILRRKLLREGVIEPLYKLLCGWCHPQLMQRRPPHDPERGPAGCWAIRAGLQDVAVCGATVSAAVDVIVGKIAHLGLIELAFENEKPPQTV